MTEYNGQLALAILCDNAEKVNAELEKIYTVDTGVAGVLYDAERYSLLAGGKRVRAALVLESCKMLGGQEEAALPFACAIEMVHTYSLIHDDLPCMDNDDLRRGKPTNHKVYGEAIATLAGDGLLTDAFSICAMNPHVSGDCAAAAVAILSSAAGSYGMIKGQVIDLQGEKQKLSEAELIELHMGKTGAMICASVQLGCMAAGYAPNHEMTEKLSLFAQKIGLVFQIVDDILDVTSTNEELGKNIGSDKDSNKTTFLSFFSIEEAQQYANRLTSEAIELIEDTEGAQRLINLAAYLCDRKK
jgi:geranylgeranyl diphosphate synthase type II